MGQIVSGDVVVTGKEALNWRLFDEETNQYNKYLAFSLNFSSNCDYNNR